MRDCDGDRTIVGEPDFNLLLITDPYEPWRFRIEGTIRLGHRGVPYVELETRLKRLLLIRRAGSVRVESESDSLTSRSS